MVDWWQPILYIGAGGVVSLVTAFVTNRLTRSTTRESEERQAKSRVEEEQRQAIRQSRRERVRPVVDFIESAKLRYAFQGVGNIIDNLQQRSERRSEMEEVQRNAPSIPELTRLYFVAFVSSWSIPGLQDELKVLLGAFGDPEMAGKWDQAIASAEELIERFIASATPGRVRPAGIAGQEAASAPTVTKT